MSYILAFSTTQMVGGLNGTGASIWSIVDPSMANTNVFGTGSITRFVASQQSGRFNFSLRRMSSRVECEEVLMPSNVGSIEDLDKWLMELNLE